MASKDSFGARGTFEVGGTTHEIFRISAVPGSEKLPFTHKVLLENLLRTEDGANVTADQIEALGAWDAAAEPHEEIQFTPARVIMQDFTGVPCVVDLATMREAMQRPRRRPGQDQPAGSGRAGHRPLGHRRLLRLADGADPQRRAGVRAQPGALPVPALGTVGVRRVQGRPPEHRHRAPGQPRGLGARGHGPQRAGVSRHVRGHRLAHDDGQRPGRARAGGSAASRPRPRCSASRSAC